MNSRNYLNKKQNGAALMVAMVMIFMLTVMGLKAMRSSNLDRRMTANAIQSSITFQAAESATELVLNDPANMNAALKGKVKMSPELSAAPELLIGVDFEYVGDGTASGYSLGTNSGGFIALRYEALGTATINTTNAESNVLQGAYRIVPAP